MSEHSDTPRGWGLVLARAFWLAVAALTVGLFVAGAPEYYHQLRTLYDPELGNPAMVRANLADVGLSAGVYAAYLLALGVGLSVVGFVVGALIFWRKSAEPMALLVALMLDETDLKALGEGLVAVARDTVQAAHVSLWLGEAAGRSGETLE